MTTDTEALRAQFEWDFQIFELIRNDVGDYTDRVVRLAWIAYQQGYAAAKAETAAPVVGRWYFVTNDGAATLCVDEADAREGAAEADIAFPRMAPHRAVQLVPADQLAAAVAAGPENDMQYLVDEFEKSLPPMGHPLRKLGVRLTELLDEDQWAECERLLLEGWEHDAADRATGARWRANAAHALRAGEKGEPS